MAEIKAVKLWGKPWCQGWYMVEGMLPLPMLYQTLQKLRKTLHFLKSYEQTPKWTENGET